MESNKFIQNEIGETLLITLYMKSIETLRKKPIFTDYTACRLVQEIDYDFKKFDDIVLSRIGTVVRASYFDSKLTEFIKNFDKPVVVIIGCGLDSRVERIGRIARKAEFYQVDIPEVMNIRESLITKFDNENNIAASMLEDGWLEPIMDRHLNSNFLFIIEGVLMYFDEIDVKSVFQKIAKHLEVNSANGEIIFDIPSVWSQKHSDKHDAMKFVKAKFKYGTDDDTVMEKWASNLTHISTKLYSEFPEWKRAGWKGKIMSLIPLFNKAHRLVHYKIG